MTGQETPRQFPVVGDGSKLEQSPALYPEELQLATRNRGMPLEALRYDVTPTGLHYLLVHYDIPIVDASTWRLTVDGHVTRPLSLDLEDIRRMPSRTLTVTMECAGNGRARLQPRPLSQPWLVEAIGTAEWTGTPLRGVLEAAGLTGTVKEVLFTGLDRGVEGGIVQYYQRSLPPDEAAREEVLLAYEMNGQPLQPQHGYPLRLLVPGWYGMTSVKWLTRIEAIDHRFDGYQMQAYRYAQSNDDPGEPVGLMNPRALMVPPGIPEFLTRTRLVAAGRVTLSGRAWAGRRGIARVEVSTDGNQTWGDAELGKQVSPYAWRAWTYEWDARPGRYVLSARATDAEGSVQPTEQRWNVKGMGNNMAQRIDVIVE